MRLPRWHPATAIVLYTLWSVMLIAQKPGLYNDEAIITAGAVHMQHSAGLFEIEETPDSWVCPFHRCIPIMTSYYIGPVKEYLALPFYELLGARTPVVRIVSVILGGVGIWGFWLLAMEFLGRKPAFYAAVALAINPSYVNMTIFDYAAVGALMAGFGLSCAALFFYVRSRSFGAAFALGAAIGFGVWARANFVWIAAAGFVAAAVIYRKLALPPVRHIGAVVLGGLTGGAPFLYFQVLSKGATWSVQRAFQVSEPMEILLRRRWFWFSDMLISDGEHRRMWAGPVMPAWEMWLFPIVVALALIVCLVPGGAKNEAATDRETKFGRAAAVAFVVLSVSLFSSRLEIAEHHLIELLPIAVVLVVAACLRLRRMTPRSSPAIGALALVYLGCVVAAQAASVSGLHETRGVDVWSDAGLDVAKYLDQDLRGSRINLMDWGFEYNLYVLTSGRVQGVELYSAANGSESIDGRPWIDVIRGGGVFLFNGPQDRQVPKPSEAFLQALANTRPEMRRKQFLQHSGRVYAVLYDIVPNSIRGPAAPGGDAVTRLPMSDSGIANRIDGFNEIEQGGFRWSKRMFSAKLDFPFRETGGALSMDLYIPDLSIRKLRSLTLSARIGSHPLASETWTKSGHYIYRRDIPAEWAESGAFTVEFSLDNALPPGSADGRELGVIVREISIVPE